MKESKNRLLPLALCLTMTLGLAACGSGDGEKPESKEPEDEAVVVESTAPQVMGERDFWNGDWYGTWVVTQAEGDCEQLAGMQNSSCASIFIEENGEGMFLSWDYTGNRDEYDTQLCNAMVTLESNEHTDYLEQTEGWFWDEALPDDWLILRADTLDGWEAYTDAIVVTNEYHVDDGVNKGSLQYIIFLRPWGTVWSDLEAESPGMLAPDYYDWYLPLVEAGESMPDSYQ